MSAAGPAAVNARLAQIAGCILGLLALAHALVAAAGLKHVGPVRWPTDLYALGLVIPDEIDLLLLGSSRSTFGLAPTAIDPCLGERLGRPTHTWSWSRANASLWSQRLVAREALARTRPGVVVIEVAPEMMSPHHYEHGWNSVTEADPRDIPSCFQGADGLDGWADCLYPLVRPLDNLVRSVERARIEPPHLRWMALFARGGQFCFGTPACVAHNARFEARLDHRWGDRLAEVIPKVRAERFRDYAVGPPHTDAMVALLDEVEAVGARALIVRMPVHEVYAAEIPAEAEAAFSAYLGALVDERGLTLVDADRWWRGDRARFHDPDHLSPVGALELSRALCAAAAPLLDRRGAGAPPSAKE